ncbi:hypothetical protein [Desulfolutivibrio sp.]|uniref:hypothetical protein n=1 Tax=Desulfolutivibrio sp. TaxID=2773296 RepID=UPI002F96A0A8
METRAPDLLITMRQKVGYLSRIFILFQEIDHAYVGKTPTDSGPSNRDGWRLVGGWLAVGWRVVGCPGSPSSHDLQESQLDPLDFSQKITFIPVSKFWRPGVDLRNETTHKVCTVSQKL